MTSPFVLACAGASAARVSPGHLSTQPIRRSCPPPRDMHPWSRPSNPNPPMLLQHTCQPSDDDASARPVQRNHHPIRLGHVAGARRGAGERLRMHACMAVRRHGARGCSNAAQRGWRAGCSPAWQGATAAPPPALRAPFLATRTASHPARCKRHRSTATPGALVATTAAPPDLPPPTLFLPPNSCHAHRPTSGTQTPCGRCSARSCRLCR